MPLTALASVKSRLVLPFWYRLTPGSPGQRAVKRVCVCVCATFISFYFISDMRTHIRVARDTVLFISHKQQFTQTRFFKVRRATQCSPCRTFLPGRIGTAAVRPAECRRVVVASPEKLRSRPSRARVSSEASRASSSQSPSIPSSQWPPSSSSAATCPKNTARTTTTSGNGWWRG